MSVPNSALTRIDPSIVSGSVSHEVEVTFNPDDNNIHVDCLHRLGGLGAEADTDTAKVTVWVTTIVGPDDECHDKQQVIDAACDMLTRRLIGIRGAGRIDDFVIGETFGSVIDPR